MWLKFDVKQPDYIWQEASAIASYMVYPQFYFYIMALLHSGKIKKYRLRLDHEKTTRSGYY